MKKICPIILAAAVAVIALFTSSCGSRSQQPVYDGKPLSEWISDLSYQKPKALRVQAQQSLRQIGTNAIPFLLEEMDDLGIMWRGGVTNFYNTPVLKNDTIIFTCIPSAWANCQARGSIAD